jgi:hypothetical protein
MEKVHKQIGGPSFKSTDPKGDSQAGSSKNAGSITQEELEKVHEDFRSLTPEAIRYYPIENLMNMTLSDLERITPSIEEYMTEEQLAAIRQRKEDLKPKVNINLMRSSQIKHLLPSDLKKLSLEELIKIKPSKLAHMTPEIRQLYEELKAEKKKESDAKKFVLELYSMDPIDIAAISLSTLEQLTPSEAANLRGSILEHMTPQQRALVHEIAKKVPPKSYPGVLAHFLDPDRIAKLAPEELNKLSPDQINNLTQEQLDAMTQEQRDVVEKLKGTYSSISTTDNSQTQTHRHSGGSGKSKPSKKKSQVGGHGHGHGHHGHAPVDFIKGKIPNAENLPPMTQFETKEFVQDEIQKQYVHLQDQQRQLANDIHDKMEFIYQRLLKEIVTQNDGKGR